jgi:hypothetical protein
MRLLAITGKGERNTLVRFPMDRIRGGQFLALLPAPGLVGTGQWMGRWVPAALGKVIPLKGTAPVCPDPQDRGDGEGDAA